MKGSIRVALGLLIIVGVAGGGLDDPAANIFVFAGLGILGIVLMLSGLAAMTSQGENDE